MSKAYNNTKALSAKETQGLIAILKSRFEKNIQRHKGIDWAAVPVRLEKNPTQLWSLSQMEQTGGEPDVIGYDKKKDAFTFCDCSAESPAARRSCCYDHEALGSRKANKPADSAINMAADMGIEILTEDEYRQLQALGRFDTKTSSWVYTPPEIRKPGGAIFCDLRFGRVFTYHNGAESYYAGRAFRGSLTV